MPQQIYVREANGEVLVCLDRHMGDRFNAILEAIRILQREVIRERVNADRSDSGSSDSNELPANS